MDESGAMNPVAATATSAPNRDEAAGGATRMVRVPAAYLARAMVRMAVGLVLSTVVRLAARSNEQLVRFAVSNFRYLVIAQPQYARSL